MSFFKAIKQKLFNIVARQTSSTLPKVSRSTLYKENVSKHRTFYSIYDLVPGVLLNTYVSPNATIAGEVFVGLNSSIWHNVVIRGDINSVKYRKYLNNYN